MPSIQVNVGMEQFRVLMELAKARGLSLEEMLAQAFENVDEATSPMNNLLSYEALPEYEVILRRKPPSDGRVMSDAQKPVRQRTKLGGLPEWIHADETPVCPDCGRWMSFIAQIDSLDAGSEGPYMFGDCGMIFLFHCFDCGNSHAVDQSY